MSKLLYIEDQLINLPSNVIIAQTLQLFEPGRLGSIVTNFTSSIRIKDTFLNEQILGFLSNSKTKSDIPYSSLACKYVENGIPLIRNGRIVINEVNDGYSFSIYSGPWGFFERIQNKTLWDLDFLDINGPWDQAARDGYRNTVTGIVQALVDDGRLDQNAASTAPTIENQGTILKPPQVYLHTVFEKIFSTFGFELESDILTNDIYKKLVWPLSLIYNDPSFLESKQFFAAATGTQVIVNPVAAVNVVFDQNVKQGSDNFYDGISEYVISNPDTPERYFRLIFFADLTITVTGGTVDLRIEATGYTPEVLLNKGSGSYTFSFLSSLGHADTDIVKVTIINSSGTPTVDVISGQFYTSVVTGTDGLEFFPSIVPAYVYFNKLFEEIKLLDFLRDMCVRFGLQITQLGNKIAVYSLNTILDRRTGPNWTTKRHARPDRIKWAFSSYRRNNIIKASIDSDFTPDLTDAYGNGSFEIPNENLGDSGTIYTSMFGVSQMINTFGVFMLKLNLEPDVTNFARMPGNRLFFVRENYAHEPPVLYDTVDRSDYMVGYFFDPNEDYEMSWQFFIDNFQQKFIDRCLRKVRLIEREYNLSDLDIFSFDQQYPILDSGERFLVSKVVNRVSGKRCKVELLKIEANPKDFFVFGTTHEISGDIEDTVELIGDTELDELSVEMELVENITGNPVWQTTFDNGTESDVLVCPGNGFSDNGVLDHVGELDVDANVLKTSNDGNGPDGFPVVIGWVEWLRNGVQVNTVTFNSSSHSNAQGLDFTFVDVVAWEILKVIVHEDGTTP